MYKADLKGVATIYRPGTGPDALYTLFLIIINNLVCMVGITDTISQVRKSRFREELHAQDPSEIKWQRGTLVTLA